MKQETSLDFIFLGNNCYDEANIKTVITITINYSKEKGKWEKEDKKSNESSFFFFNFFSFVFCIYNRMKWKSTMKILINMGMLKMK